MDVEAARSRGARVHDQRGAELFDHRAMRVTVDDHVSVISRREPFGRGRTEFVAVTHVDPRTLQFDVDGFRQLEPLAVRVAAYGSNRSDVFEGSNDALPAHVTGVQDHVNARQSLERFRPYQAVRVGDKPYQHDFNIVISRSPQRGPKGEVWPESCSYGKYPSSHAPAVFQ